MSALAAAGLPGAAMSVGDTPGCRVVEDLHGPNELRPGNFVFYDAQQLRLGVCVPSDLALVVACPVVASYPDRQEVIVQGGAVHLSKDHVTAEDGSTLYGLVMDLASDWSLLDARTARVTGVSQEHGVVHLERRRCEQTRIGSLLHVVPAHACLAANALGPNIVTV
jgi:D-serine deaminase-like pyridoxal phosphate-dependent protein